jgi:hypothetical protein
MYICVTVAGIVGGLGNADGEQGAFCSGHCAWVLAEAIGTANKKHIDSKVTNRTEIDFPLMIALIFARSFQYSTPAIKLSGLESQKAFHS